MLHRLCWRVDEHEFGLTAGPAETRRSSREESVARVDGWGAGPLRRIARHPPWFRWAFFLVLALAFAARLRTWANVFTPDGVALVPTDSYYYIRFARLQLAAFPRFVTFDPFVNFPDGAHIYWPPAHTWLLSLAIAIVGEPRAETVAAWLGPGLTLLDLLVVGLLSRRWFGAGIALGVLVPLALLPAAVEAGALGTADHHVHEGAWSALSLLALVHALRSGRRRDGVTLGLVLGAGRFFTTSAFGLFPLAGLVLAAWALRAPARAVDAASIGTTAGAVSATVLLIGSVAFGLPASLHYEALSLFQPLWAWASLAGGAAVAALRAHRWHRFALLATTTAAALVPVALELSRAAGHLRRDDPLLQVVTESTPLLADPVWGLRLLGAAVLLVPFAFWGAVKSAWEKSPLALGSVLFVVLLVPPALLQVRFIDPLAGALAVLLPVGLAALWQSRSRLGRLILAGASAVVIGLMVVVALRPEPPSADDNHVLLVRPTLTWMRANTSPATDAPYSQRVRPVDAVVADFNFGHLIVLWAERPVMATPFSQAPWHRAGNQRAGDILASWNDENAFRLARANGVRYVLATPFGPILGRLDVPEDKTLASRMLEHAGLGRDGEDGTPHFRLIRNSPERRARGEGGPFARLLEVVPGAWLEGRAEPGERVTAELDLVDNLGLRLRYVRRARADRQGAFEIRVAYPTSPSGPGRTTAVAPYRVSWAGAEARVHVSEADVAEGRTVPVTRGPTEAPTK